MPSDVISQHPSLFNREFLKDLAAIREADGNVVRILCDFLKSVDEYDKLSEEQHWVTVAKSARQSIDDLIALCQPARWIAIVSRQESVPISTTVDQLGAAGFIEDDTLRERVLALAEAWESTVAQGDEKAAISIPLLHIKRIRTRCVLVSEFDREFSLREEPDQYEPHLRRLCPTLTLELEFHETEHQRIGIALTQESLDTLSKWLEFSKVQLRVAASEATIGEKHKPLRKEGGGDE